MTEARRLVAIGFQPGMTRLDARPANPLRRGRETRAERADPFRRRSGDLRRARRETCAVPRVPLSVFDLRPVAVKGTLFLERRTVVQIMAPHALLLGTLQRQTQLLLQCD